MNDPDLNGRLPVEPVPEGLEQRLRAALPAQFDAVRPLPSLSARVGITLLLLVVLVLALGLLTGGKGWHALDGLQRTALGSLLAAGLVSMAFELSLRMTPGSRLRAPAALPVLAITAAATVWVFGTVDFAEQSKLFYPICVAYTSIAALLTAWVLNRWLRRGLLTSPSRWIGAGAAGLAAFGVIQLFCPMVDVAHIVTSHLLPAAAVGAAVGSLVFRNKVFRNKVSPK